MTVTLAKWLCAISAGAVVVCIVTSVASILHPAQAMMFIDIPLILTGFALLLSGGASLGLFQLGRLQDLLTRPVGITREVGRSKTPLVGILGGVGIVGGVTMAIWGLIQAGTGKYVQEGGRYVDVSVSPAQTVTQQAYKISNVIAPVHLFCGGSLFVTSSSLLLLATVRKKTLNSDGALDKPSEFTNS